MGISRKLIAAIGAALASAALLCFAALAASPADPHALFMALAFDAPKKGACEVLSPDPAYVNEMLVRFDEKTGAKLAPERRVALVIGNGAYEAFPDLKNPANDAAAVARLLRGLGFAVWRGVDLTSASASACLADFYRRGAEGAHVALLYYAGHGVSAGGVNALLPVDASFTDASESALNKALPVDAILGEMRKRAISSLLFLDACRSSLGRGFEAIRPEGSSAGNGAQRQTKVAPGSDSGGGSAPELGGFYYVYAAAPNATASDGEGDHSPFTRAFLDHAATPGQLVPALVIDMTRDVIKAARQTPFFDGTLTEDVYLNGDLSEREMASRSAEFAAQSATYRGQGLKSKGVAQSLKAVSAANAEQINTRAALAELNRNYISRSFVLSLPYVTDVEFSRDGRTFYGIGHRGNISVYDAFSGSLIKHLKAPRKGRGDCLTEDGRFSLDRSCDIRGIAVSRDGRLLVTAAENSITSLWDVNAGRLIRELPGSRTDILAIDTDISPDGKRIVTAYRNASFVDVWDLETGARTWKVIGGNGGKAVAFSANGARIAGAGNDGSVLVWDAASGADVRRITCQSTSQPFRGYEEVKFTPDDSALLIASDLDGAALICDVATGELRRAFPHPDRMNDAAFSPDGSKIATAGYAGVVKLWDAQSGAEIRSFSGHVGGVGKVSFSPDGRFLLTHGWDGTTRTWPVRPEAEQERYKLDGHAGAVVDAYVAADNTRALTVAKTTGASGGEATDASYWEITRGNAPSLLRRYSRMDLASLSSDAKSLLLVEQDRNGGVVVDPNNGEVLLRFAGGQYNIKQAQISADRQRIMAIWGDQSARIWDLNTRDLIGQHIVPWRGLVAIAPDLSKVASSYGESGVVWEVPSLRQIAEFNHPRFAGISSLSFSADGKRLVTGSSDTNVRIWDASTGKQACQLTGHTDWVYDAQFSPDGARVVSASKDRSVRVWDAASCGEIMRFNGHENEVHSARFSPDQEHVISGSADATARLFYVGPYGKALLDAAYDLLTDDLRAEVERERIRYWEVDPKLLQ